MARVAMSQVLPFRGQLAVFGGVNGSGKAGKNIQTIDGFNGDRGSKLRFAFVNPRTSQQGIGFSLGLLKATDHLSGEWIAI